MKCVACGADNPATNRFCGMCASALTAPAEVNASPGEPAAPKAPPAPPLPDLPEEWLLDGVGVMPAGAKAGPPPRQRKPIQRTGLPIVDPPEPAQAPDANDGPRPVYSDPPFIYDQRAPHGASADGGGFTLLGLDDNDRGWSTPDYLLEDEEKPWGRILVWSAMAFGLAIWLAVLAVNNPQWRQGALQTVHLAQNQMTATRTSSALPAPAAPPPTEASQPAAVDSSAVTPASDPGSAAPSPASVNPSSASAAPALTAGAPPSNSPAKVAGGAASDAPSRSAAAAATPGKEATAAGTQTASGEDVSTKDTAKPSKTNRTDAKKPGTDAQNHADDALVTRAQTFLRYRGSRNCSQAMSLLQQAAAHGNSRASSQLGALYATGSCTRLDRAMAYHYFSRAAEAEPNNAYLKHDCDMLWQQMSAQERRRVME